MDYYIYRHIRLDKNEPFYIGVGKIRDKYTCDAEKYSRARSICGRNKTWKDIYNKSGFKVEIVEEKLSKLQASELETHYIKLYGRIIKKDGTLANYDSGGYHNADDRPSIQKIVSKYTEKGELIETYKSLASCARNNNISSGRLHDAINKKIKRNNFIYEYGDKQNISPIYKKYKKVQKLDLENNILEEYENIRQASILTGIPATTLWQYCNDLRNSKKYKWIYKTN